MSDGFLFWYQGDWTPRRARECVAGLEAAGMSLGHRKTGRITAISSAEESLGEQVDIDREALLRRVALDVESDFTFQYWIDVDVDVVSTVQRLAPDLVVQRLYLDGLTTDQVQFVVGLVADQIRVGRGSTRGMVVDRRGDSANEDWDAIVAGAAERVAVRANVVGLPREVAAMHPEVYGGTTTSLADLVVFDPEGLLPGD
jgi:hypothetical protein